jgi:hypothetical protein
MHLTEEAVRDLWRRFGGFHDAVIRVVELRPETDSALVHLDAAEVVDGRWYRVRSEFDGLQEWRFEQIRSDTIVVYEARAAVADGLTYVSFDAATMPERPLPDDFQATVAYIAAQTASVTDAPLG